MTNDVVHAGLAAGFHQLQVTLTPPFSPALYDIALSGGCTQNGVVNLTQGQAATCEVLIRHH
jgi:hypothetical protein